jgi:hypothetical protein
MGWLNWLTGKNSNAPKNASGANVQKNMANAALNNSRPSNVAPPPNSTPSPNPVAPVPPANMRRNNTIMSGGRRKGRKGSRKARKTRKGKKGSRRN